MTVAELLDSAGYREHRLRDHDGALRAALLQLRMLVAVSPPVPAETPRALELARKALALDEKAFRAPWTYSRFLVECRHDERPVCGEKDEDDCQGDGEVVRVESPNEYPGGQVVCDVPGLEEFADANGEFIAFAREALPALARAVLAPPQPAEPRACCERAIAEAQEWVRLHVSGVGAPNESDLDEMAEWARERAPLTPNEPKETAP